MTSVVWDTFPSRLGRMWAASTEEGLCSLALGPVAEDEFVRGLAARFRGAWLERWPGVSADVAREVEEYLGGSRKQFSLPVHVVGSPFHIEIWEAVRRIPYGAVRSYSSIAAESGRPRAARAVGQAVGANRVLLLVPCHRVVASNGGLGGFGYGLELKVHLLALERGAVDGLVTYGRGET